MKNYKNTVPVFFAVDKAYLPYLAVAVSSLKEHASEENLYEIRVLSSSLEDTDLDEIKTGLCDNITLSVVSVEEKIDALREKLSLRLRDYYSESIYYRLFIPSLFPKLDKALYLDADIVLTDDVARLYETDLTGKLLGVVTDESVITVPVFCDYVVKHVGVSSPDKYFNSGVLVMNLAAIREAKIESRFTHLVSKYNFPTVAPDQDYLNFLCRDRVVYLDAGWNKHAIDGRYMERENLHLIHFNMFNKPWHYDNVLFEDYFWEAARKSAYYNLLLAEKAGYSEDKRAADMAGAGKLLSAAEEIFKNGTGMPEIVCDGYFEKLGI